MKANIPIIILVLLLVHAAVLAEERIRELRVHGNVQVSKSEIISIAAVKTGDLLNEDTLANVQKRLMSSGMFERVEVLKRFIDLEQQDRPILVIHVYEKESFIRKLSARPVIQFDSEFGNSYGAEVTFFDVLGMDEAATFSLVFGGIKDIGIRLRKDFSGVVFNRVVIEGGLREFENPHFEELDSRNYFGLTLLRNIGISQFDFSARYEDVEFMNFEESAYNFGVGILLDTRNDRFLPDTSYRLGARFTHYNFSEESNDVNQYSFFASGFLKPFNRLVVAANVRADVVDEPLPAYLKPYLGSASRLRGYDERDFIGDNIIVSSLELRYPLSPITGNLLYGLIAFYDSGAVYDDGIELSDAVFRHSYGGGAFFNIEDLAVVVSIGTNRDNDDVVAYVRSSFNF